MPLEIDELKNFSTAQILKMYIEKLHLWIKYKVDPTWFKIHRFDDYQERIKILDSTLKNLRCYFLIRKDSDPSILALAEQKCIQTQVNVYHLTNDQVNQILMAMLKQAQFSMKEFQRVSRAN